MGRDRWNHSNRVGCGLAFGCFVSYSPPRVGPGLPPQHIAVVDMSTD
jgi:hypothetical protein